MSQPGDALETEARRLADRAVNSGRTAESRADAPPVDMPAASVVSAIPDSGSPMDAPSRSRWEGRFGHGFERVRIHTGPQADRSARAFGARAYADGDHLVFRHGEYAPDTPAGAELLAHELAHVVQHRSGILRLASDDDLKAFETLITEIRGWKTFTSLKPQHKQRFEEVVSEARRRENALYYGRKLNLLFRIPSPAALTKKEEAEVEQENIERNRGRIEESLEEEKWQAQWPDYEKDLEEQTAEGRFGSGHWQTRQGEGATYRVDISDYNNIVVQLKLHLVPRQDSKTTQDDIRKMKGIEQGVERAAARVGGYVFDLRFVDVDGPDVFRVTVDVGQWPTSGNIVGGAETLVHEVHHLLNLPDRYDYIEAHAENEAMSVQYRLRLFQRQMQRGIRDPLAPYSLMNEGGPDRRLTDEDVCLVADPEHAEECIARRSSAKLELIRLRAWTQAVGTWNALIDVIAGGNPAAAANAERLAAIVFREPVAPGALASRALAMAGMLDMALRFNVVLSTSPAALEEELELTNRGDLRCQKLPLWANMAGGAAAPASSISICSYALLEDEKCQTQSLLAAAAEMTGLKPFVGSGCPYYECTRPSGIGLESADSWAQFIYCFSRTLASAP